MEILELNVNTRTSTGKGPARSLRRDGKIPAILYGAKTEPVSLALDLHELDLLLKTSASSQQIVNLKVDGGSHRTAMIKELQRDPVSRVIEHADFYEVDMDRPIRVRVPVQVIGKCAGVELGGMLQVIRRELEVLSLPAEVPEAIVIDVTELDIGDSVHVDEIPTEGNLEIPYDVNFTVVTVLSPTKVEEEEVPEDELEEGEEPAEGEEETPEETEE